jgi:hypothetical protein
MRCRNSLLGVERSLFGSADFPDPAPGNPPDIRLNLCRKTIISPALAPDGNNSLKQGIPPG